jgi:glycosyltransferase involved in cell wall biosynthesis
MRPIVSIWLTTYNHGPFIARSLDSILLQKTSFSYEIVIGEDCSTDNTRAIVQEYKARYPDKIRLLLPDKNLGMIGMFKASYALCTGHYIAWMDGDDYWTDPLKLQKQVDFLEAHPEYVLYFHRVNILDGDRLGLGYAPPYLNADNSLETKHFLKGYNPVASSSVLHRNEVRGELPEWLLDLVFLDYGLYLLLLRFGKFHYSEEPMAVYRVHEGGAYSGKEDEDNMSDMIRFANQIKLYFPELKRKDVDSMIGYQHYKQLLTSLKKGSFSEIREDFYKMFSLNPKLVLVYFKPLAAVAFSRLTQSKEAMLL